MKKYIVLLSLVLTACGSGSKTPTKIMALGDSITFGVGWDGVGGDNLDSEGYRDYLVQQLTGDIEMVGSHQTGNFSQNANEGHPGWRAIGKVTNGAWRDGLYEHMAQWFYQGTKPDIVLLHIGTNDIGIEPSSTTVAERSVEDVGTLVDEIHNLSPNTVIYIAQIINISPTMPTLDVLVPYLSNIEDQTNKYNALLPTLAETRPFVKIVAMPALAPSEMFDWAHPNKAGYKKMADAWAAALK